MKQIPGYLTELPVPSRVHAGDYYALRFHPDGNYPWQPPRSPDEDKSSGGMKSAQSWYSCCYCGSIHPRELAAAIAAGARVHWADWKYAWPHKLYVDDAPNRYEGELEIRGGVTFCGSPPQAEIDAGKWERYQKGYSQETGEPVYSYRTPLPPGEPAKATAWAKFYTVHLQDADPADRIVIERAMKLSFTFETDNVGWCQFVEPA